MTPYSGKIAENCLTGSLGPHEKPCPTCDGGKNVVEGYLACPTCDATGVVDSARDAVEKHG
jgi:DnaJ-class molecular chaperone